MQKPLVPRMRGPTFEWFVELDAVPGLVSDGRSEIVGDLVITTLPYCADEKEKELWLNRGRRMRTERRLKWLVLHHERRLRPALRRKSPRKPLPWLSSIGPIFGFPGTCTIFPNGWAAHGAISSGPRRCSRPDSGWGRCGPTTWSLTSRRTP